MFTNATVTVTRDSAGIDPTTGYRTSATPATVCENEPCLFSPARGARRQVYAHGQQQTSKPSYPVMIPNMGVVIQPGDTAVVVCEGISQTFVVAEAVPASGVGESHWECDLERVKSPA